jgi:hypothetical protein
MQRVVAQKLKHTYTSATEPVLIEEQDKNTVNLSTSLFGMGYSKDENSSSKRQDLSEFNA